MTTITSVSTATTRSITTPTHSGMTKIWRAVADFFLNIANKIKTWLGWIRREEPIVKCEKLSIPAIDPGLALFPLTNIFKINLDQVKDAEYIQNVMDIYRALAEGAQDERFCGRINNKEPVLVMALVIYAHLITGSSPEFVKCPQINRLRMEYLALTSEEQQKVINGKTINQDATTTLVKDVEALARHLSTNNVPFAKALKRVE